MSAGPIRFASAHLAAEWGLVRRDLRALLVRANDEWAAPRGYSLLVTHLIRTHAQHVRIYSPKHGPDPAKWPPGVPRVSPHEPDRDGIGRACDLRCRDYSRAEIAELVAWFNAHGPARTDGKPTALAHDVGLGMHFHVQVPR